MIIPFLPYLHYQAWVSQLLCLIDMYMTSFCMVVKPTARCVGKQNVNRMPKPEGTSQPMFGRRQNLWDGELAKVYLLVNLSEGKFSGNVESFTLSLAEFSNNHSWTTLVLLPIFFVSLPLTFITLQLFNLFLATSHIPSIPFPFNLKYFITPWFYTSF